MKKIMLMLAFCGALATMPAQNGTGGEDMSSPNTATPNPTYTPNPSTGQNPSNDNSAIDNQGGMGQGGSDQGTNGSYQGSSGVSGTQSSSQNRQNNIDVPEKVKSAFSDKYQDANATWSKEGQNYKARFKDDPTLREETIVVYDKNGEVVRTQRMLKSDDYPESISKYYKDQNTDMKGYDVWEVTGNGPTKYYTSHGGKMTWFDNEGNVMHGTAHAGKGKSSTQNGSSSYGHKNHSSSNQKSGSKSGNSNMKKSSTNTGGDNTDQDIDRNR